MELWLIIRINVRILFWLTKKKNDILGKLNMNYNRRISIIIDSLFYIERKRKICHTYIYICVCVCCRVICSDQSELLWKRVIRSNHYQQGDQRVLEINGGRRGGLCGQITNLSCFRLEMLEMVSKGMWRIAGGGKSALFWEHQWIREQTLKAKFPRLYSISN